MTTGIVFPVLAAAALLQGSFGSLIEELDARPPRTGYFMLSVSPAEILGFDEAQRFNHVLAPEEPIEWQVYVPRNYDPQQPVGLLVFIPSGNRGGIPFEWQPLMDDRGLIWVSANMSGGSVPIKARMLKAILAPRAIKRDYRVDEERTYIGGYIDGGVMASLVQASEPQLFKGGLYFCGALYWEEQAPANLPLVLANRHVFIRGCVDEHEREIRGAHESYVAAGAENTELISLHPNRDLIRQFDYVERALAFLDPPEAPSEPDPEAREPDE